MAERHKTEPVPTFPKEELLRSKRFAHRKDALSFLLKDNELYSIEEVDKILTKYYERKVT